MKKNSKSKNTPKVDPYLEGLMAKLLERLVSVEKKLDTVVAQTAGKTATHTDTTKSFQNPEANQPPRRDRILYEAICADCHKVCEVPFKPSEDRPVYCKECFAKRKAGGRQNGNAGKPNFNLTPVALKPKPVGKLGIPTVPAPAPEKPKKTKKISSAKKAKKKK